MYILDTDTCIWIVRGREPARSRVKQQSPEDLRISAMTVAELYFGALRSGDPEGAHARIAALLEHIEILPFDESATVEHAAVRQALVAQPIGERDLIIAATALAHSATLVSGNTREFARVPGLSIESWQ